MKRLPLAALVAAFFIFLVLSVSVRQAVLLLVGHLSSLFQAFGIASAGKYLGRITRGVWLLCVCLATPVPPAGVRLRLDEPAVLVPALGT